MNAPTLPFPAQEPYTGPRTGDQLAGLAHLERVALEQAATRMAQAPPPPRAPHSPGRWRRRLRLALPLVAVFTLCLSLGSGPARSAGVTRYLAPVCGRGWVPISVADSHGMTHGDYFNIYNEPDGLSCVRAQDGRNGNLSWYVSWRGNSQHGWEYPNISSGIEWGRYTCYDGKSGLKASPGSRCMRYPVQARDDGTPLTSVTYWPHMTSGIADYDIWFNKTSPANLAALKQNDGAEVMIWLSHPGIPLSHYRILWKTRILGRLYYVTGWTPGAGRPGATTWLYTAYIAARQTRSLPPTWLNYFFRDAERHGRLSPDWWLTAIDFGAEMNPGTLPDGAESGTGFAVKSYTLTGVR